MPYFLILIVLIGLAISLYFLMGDDAMSKGLSKSRISDITHTVISDGGDYALVMYHHDQYDEAQLSWALSNAKGLGTVGNHNIFFYNIGSGALSKRIINSTFVKINENDFTVLNGHPGDRISYMFIIKYKEERIVFNTEIDK